MDNDEKPKKSTRIFQYTIGGVFLICVLLGVATVLLAGDSDVTHNEEYHNNNESLF